MRINKGVIYANIIALVINGITVWLVITKSFPPMLGITLFVAFLAGSVWFSLYINGKLPKRGHSQGFQSKQTENEKA